MDDKSASRTVAAAHRPADLADTRVPNRRFYVQLDWIGKHWRTYHQQCSAAPRRAYRINSKSQDIDRAIVEASPTCAGLSPIK
jgi:hypothetical protein